MTINRALLGTLVACALATPAISQTTQPVQPNNSTMPSKDVTVSPPATPTTSMSGITMTDKPNSAMALKYATADSADLWSSKLIGVNVYNNNNERIGEVEDLAIDNGRTLSGVVLSVGGFLGINERYVLIEPNSIALRNDNGTWKAYVNTNKDSLKAAPTFTYKKTEQKS